MALIKPVFQDGVYIKTNDLTRMRDYAEQMLMAGMGMVGAGVLFGLRITQIPNGTGPFSLNISAGAALTQDGQLVVFSDTELDGGSFPYNSSGKFWVVKTNTNEALHRPNLLGQIKTTAEQDVFSVVFQSFSDPPPTATTKFILAQLTGIVSGGVWSPVFTYNYAIGSLTHTGASITGKIPGETLNREIYTGPRLDGTAAIIPGTITNPSMAWESVNQRTIEHPFGLVPSGTIIAYGGNVTPAQQKIYIYTSGPYFGQGFTVEQAISPYEGWLLCNGALLSQATYPHLYTAIAQLWWRYQLNTTAGTGITLSIYNTPAGSSATPAISGPYDNTLQFCLPDLRGWFLRGINWSGGADPESARISSNLLIPTAGQFPGTIQMGAVESHNHLDPLKKYSQYLLRRHMTGSDNNGEGNGLYGTTGDGDTPGSMDSDPGSGLLRELSLWYTNSGTLTAYGGAETRVKNKGVHYLIKI